MWVYLNHSFLSIVQDRADRGRLLVRSRYKGDIESAFPGHESSVFEDHDADYPYRAFIPRETVAERLARAAEEVDYDNFKGSIRQTDRLRAAHEIHHAWLTAAES